LKNFVDITNEVSKKELKAIKKKVYFTSNPSEISSCNFFIITVPTPVKKSNVPDFSFLILASEMIGQLLKKGDIVVYESTVYPGATEEICLPILEEKSKLKLNKDFFLGYSPERINPGDKKHKLANVIKIVSASNKKSLKIINDLYLEVVKAGVFKASSIKVAEASKVIENTQRDLNIALVNELSQIFNKLNIDTEEVLKGASTKWNFIKFTPGLVGGHCIGVDPYFLTFKSKKAGYNPKIILAGRNLNDNMPNFVSTKLIDFLKERKKIFKQSKILIMGLTFKENCPDIRNSKVFNLISILSKQFKMIDCYDPWVGDIKKNIEFKKINFLKKNYYDVVILCVKHDQFINLGIKKIRTLCKKDGIIYDLKYLFPKNFTDLRI
ncbi:nucleotide sugar dehydrogenase, partial [Pelagibacteraceae bacterium]|nr:nucleotide sugar dehydrogenase [Pelagibacteraceae bacterium]